MRIDHCRFEIATPQQLLDGSNVRAAFEQMWAKECGTYGTGEIKGFDPYLFSCPRSSATRQNIRGCSKSSSSKAAARIFLLLIPLIRGVAEAALYCAHRTIDALPPSLPVITLRMGAD